MNPFQSDDPARRVQLRWLIINNHDQLCRQARMASKGKNILIVNFDQRTRAFEVYHESYDATLESLEDRHRTTLEQIYSKADYYVIVGYLHDNETLTNVCTVASLRCDGAATQF